MIPLVKIEGDEIVIRLPIDAIPNAAGIAMWEGFNCEYPVIDAKIFATELVRSLKKETEAGTTLVHLMLDKAVLVAVENGAEGISLNPLKCLEPIKVQP